MNNFMRKVTIFFATIGVMNTAYYGLNKLFINKPKIVYNAHKIALNASLLDAVSGMNNDIAGARKALEAGADVNAVGNFNYAPLHFATNWGNTEMINLLFEYKADPNVVDEIGNNALRWIGNDLKNKYEVARLLILAGTDPYLRNNFFITPFGKADPEMKKVMLKALEEKKKAQKTNLDTWEKLSREK